LVGWKGMERMFEMFLGHLMPFNGVLAAQ